MSIRDYWHLPPDQQAVLRAHILGYPAPPAAASTEKSESSLAHIYKVIYASSGARPGLRATSSAAWPSAWALR